jgi:4-amino-4-deoxy-L-arabinose transferase-like glycosyltransferase
VISRQKILLRDEHVASFLREFCGLASRSCATPWCAYVLVLLLWAAIYLPGLGSVQLQHEEPRRALPALHMLASGDWLVPRVGSDPYLRKPPLLNWAIAISCKTFGSVSEWSVRIPSVLATLALAAAIVVIAGRRWLGLQGGLIAAIFFMVNFTMIETGRLAELEAVYISLTGIALILWMTSWRNEDGPWQLWLLPAPFLALGMLTKGPTHLLFFYGIVLPVLVFGKNTRSLGHPAHFVSISVILGALLCWAVPCSLAVNSDHPTSVWRFWWVQLASRVSTESDEHFRLWVWLLNAPQTLKNYLPWTLLLPLLWRKEIAGPETRNLKPGPRNPELETRNLKPGTPNAERGTRTAEPGTQNPKPGTRNANPGIRNLNLARPVHRDPALVRGARWGLVATALVMILLPNGSPRYLYPLIVVPCLLLGRALTANEGAGIPDFVESIWRRCNLVLLTVVSCGVVAARFVAPGSPRTLAWLILEASLGFSVWIFALAPARGGASTERSVSTEITRQAIISGSIAAIGMMIFAATALPIIDSANEHRPREVARKILSAMPAGTDLWVLDNAYRPFWYYLEPRARYFHNMSDLPPHTRYILVPATQTTAFLNDPAWQRAPPQRVIRVVDNENRAFDLLSRSS